MFDEDFTDDDMAVALEWQQEDRLRCHGCGDPLDVTTDPAMEDAYSSEIVACHKCATRDRTLRAWQNDKGEMAGVQVRVWEQDD